MAQKTAELEVRVLISVELLTDAKRQALADLAAESAANAARAAVLATGPA